MVSTAKDTKRMVKKMKIPTGFLQSEFLCSGGPNLALHANVIAVYELECRSL